MDSGGRRDQLIGREEKERRIGIFGGTFNPIHFGHLRGAEEIREAFNLEKVVFVPAAIPPHKAAEDVIEAKHRLEMVRIATSTNPAFTSSDIELSRPGKSYSIDTIRLFRGIEGDCLYFIVGGDAFKEIETWKDFLDLFSLSNFIVMTRPGFEGEASRLPNGIVPFFRYDQEVGGFVHVSGHRLYFKEITYLDISSTKVRELIARGESVRYLIPPEVEAYIRCNRLYEKTF